MDGFCETKDKLYILCLILGLVYMPFAAGSVLKWNTKRILKVYHDKCVIRHFTKLVLNYMIKIRMNYKIKKIYMLIFLSYYPSH